MSECKNSGKSARAFRTISEVALYLDVPQHVLRFWESKFSQVSPLKRGGGRRYYRPEDVQLLERIRDLLYVDGFKIRGVQRLIRERGVKALLSDSEAISTVDDGAAVSADSQRHAIMTAIDELSEIRKLFGPPGA